jgi:hypothetical protein
MYKQTECGENKPKCVNQQAQTTSVSLTSFELGELGI